jgi:hypothetical protein
LVLFASITGSRRRASRLHVTLAGGWPQTGEGKGWAGIRSGGGVRRTSPVTLTEAGGCAVCYARQVEPPRSRHASNTSGVGLSSSGGHSILPRGERRQLQPRGLRLMRSPGSVSRSASLRSPPRSRPAHDAAASRHGDRGRDIHQGTPSRAAVIELLGVMRCTGRLRPGISCGTAGCLRGRSDGAR